MDVNNSELMEADEDEEGIDEMNDLTFGNDLYEQDEDQDWEAQHEKLAGNLEYGMLGQSRPEYDVEQCMMQRLGLEDDDTLYQLYDGDLERKVNQLIVEEDDDDDEQGQDKRAKRSDIPHTSVNLDKLFGPSSPPGLFQVEDVGNIWGSPLRGSYLPDHAVQHLLETYQGKPIQPFPRCAMTLEEVEQENYRPQPEIHPENDWERNVPIVSNVYGNGTAAVGSNQGQPWNTPSNLLTVEEVERRLQVDSSRSEDLSALGTGQHTVNQSLPHPTPYGPSLSEVSDLLRHPGILHLPPNLSEMMHRQKMTPAMIQPPIGPPPPFRVGGYTMPQLCDPQMNIGRWPTNGRGMVMPRLPGFGPPFPYNCVPPPGYRLPPPFFDQGNDRHKHPSMQQMQQRPYFPAGFGDPSFAQSSSPHRHSMPPPPPLPQYMNMPHAGTRILPPNLINANYPLCSQQHFQQLQMLRHLSAQGINVGQGGYRPPQSYRGGVAGGKGDDEDDEYGGLMEQREKDWIVKIQLIQLHTDNPYVDDYYYTCWSMKKMLREKQLRDGIQPQNCTPESEPTLVLPQLAKSDAKAYAPVQFEGSLGKLTVSSIHNPRRMIDLRSSAPPDQDEAKRWELRRFRQTMLNIEKGYVALLDIDDIEKRSLAQPPENRSALFDERRKLIAHLFDSLHLPESQAPSLGAKDAITSTFSQLVQIRKGILLIARLLPLINKPEAETVVCALLHKLPQITKKEWQDEVWPRVYQSVSHVIKSSDLRALVLFVSQLSQDSTEIVSLNKNGLNTISSVMQNRLGVSIVTCLLSRGEVVYTTHSPLDMDTGDQQQWRLFVESVAMTLDITEKDFVVRPTENFDNVLSHFRRLLDKRWLLAVEDKLNNILPAPSPSAAVVRPGDNQGVSDHH